MEDVVESSAARLNSICSGPLLRPTGTIPDCVSRVISDLSDAVHSLVCLRSEPTHGFENWTEVVDHYYADVVSAEYKLEDAARTVLDTRVTDAGTTLAEQASLVAVQAIPNESVEVLLIDPEYPEDIDREDFNALDLIRSHAEYQLGTVLLSALVYSPVEPATTFFRNMLEVYESGLFPCGWEGEGDSGKFIAYAHSP